LPTRVVSNRADDRDALYAFAVDQHVGVRDAALALGQLNPLGHHVTNIVITEESETEVVAHSKGLGVNSDGTSGTVTYEDTVVRTPDGWRITCRKVRAAALL
jgi:SnoaL-like domain